MPGGLGMPSPTWWLPSSSANLTHVAPRLKPRQNQGRLPVSEDYVKRRFRAGVQFSRSPGPDRPSSPTPPPCPLTLDPGRPPKPGTPVVHVFMANVNPTLFARARQALGPPPPPPPGPPAPPLPPLPPLP